MSSCVSRSGEGKSAFLYFSCNYGSGWELDSTSYICLPEMWNVIVRRGLYFSVTILEAKLKRHESWKAVLAATIPVCFMGDES